MSRNASDPGDACLTDDVIALILAGEELDGEPGVHISRHLEMCQACRDVLD